MKAADDHPETHGGLKAQPGGDTVWAGKTIKVIIN